MKQTIYWQLQSIGMHVFLSQRTTKVSAFYRLFYTQVILYIYPSHTPKQCDRPNGNNCIKLVGNVELL